MFRIWGVCNSDLLDDAGDDGCINILRIIIVQFSTGWSPQHHLLHQSSVLSYRELKDNLSFPLRMHSYGCSLTSLCQHCSPDTDLTAGEDKNQAKRTWDEMGNSNHIPKDRTAPKREKLSELESPPGCITPIQTCKSAFLFRESSAYLQPCSRAGGPHAKSQEHLQHSLIFSRCWASASAAPEVYSSAFQTLFPVFSRPLPEELVLLLGDTGFVSACVCVCTERGLEG